jgi:primosomal protein N' (replication factor Y) (superfamily II helicase)
MIFARVLIPKHENMTFIYSVQNPASIKIGDVVEVELRNYKIWGVIESFTKELPEGVAEKSIKPVLGKIIGTSLFSNKKHTDFLKWFSNYYHYSLNKTVKQVLSPLINKKNELYGSSDPMKHLTSVIRCDGVEKVVLNKDQKKAVESIKSRWCQKNFVPTLVYGVTGSGKSEVFAELSREVIKSGKQVLYLVPEIGLTNQALVHLIKRVGYSGVVLHSFMTPKKRFASLYSAMHRQAGLVVGTRSSLLYPFIDPGLIIVDEEHDTSYKNFESPYYHARDAAVMKASFLNIPILLGSATPSSDSWLNVLNGKYQMESLPERANKKPLPEVKQFEFKGELYIPSNLIDFIRNSIDNKEQTLFFLNRRGFATFPVCPECSEPAKCPNCSTALVYHKKKKRLICHHCSFNRGIEKCDNCGNSGFEFEGIGIEKLKEALEQYFPEAEIVSFDKDSLNTPALFEKAVKSISDGKNDIIVGTVMISKGHNFQKLKNVIIKHADYLLSFKDTRAAEKCFQIIAQVAGRAGRFDESGVVWAEALSPEHYIWKYVATHDYPGFMREELSWRKQLMLPPYTRMTIIRIVGLSETKARKNTKEIYDNILDFIEEHKMDEIIVYPPEEPPLSKVRNKFRMNITVVSPKTNRGQKMLHGLLESVSSPLGTNVMFDIDAVNET